MESGGVSHESLEPCAWTNSHAVIVRWLYTSVINVFDAPICDVMPRRGGRWAGGRRRALVARRGRAAGRAARARLRRPRPAPRAARSLQWALDTVSQMLYNIIVANCNMHVVSSTREQPTTRSAGACSPSPLQRERPGQGVQ